MSLLDVFRQDKQKINELKIALQLNPEYYKEIERIKLKRDASPFF